MEKQTYQWTPKDKLRYFLSMIPVLLMIIGTSYIMLDFSIFLTILWLIIYVVINIFQAACCIGCPYRGKYCPAFFGVYLGNKLSSFFYKDFEFDPKQFKKNALGGEISLAIFLIYPVYWLLITNWLFLLIYLGLIILHIAIFLPTQCKRCSYSDTCPGGKSYHMLCRWFQIKK